MSPAIAVRSITKRYRGGAPANDGISLSVARGMMFGVLGPNGAGKTTLVRQITGELASTSGDIFVHATNVAPEPLAPKPPLEPVRPPHASRAPHALRPAPRARRVRGARAHRRAHRRPRPATARAYARRPP